MGRRAVIGLLAVSLTACAAAPAGPPPAGGSASTEPAASPSVGSQIVAVVGTPFYLIYKTVVCAATIVIAPPVAGLAAISDRDDKDVIRRRIDEGTTQNCGGSWVLSPTSP